MRLLDPLLTRLISNLAPELISESPMTTLTPADLNEQYREFWQGRKLRISELMENRDIVRLAFKREQRKLADMSLVTSEADRFVIFRYQVEFEEELERAAEDLAPSLRVTNARRQSAKRPGGKLVDGKSLPQIVEEAFSKPELVGLCGKDAWRALPEAMAKFGITLTEIPGNEITEDRYSYKFRKKTKTLGRGHFYNILTKCRRIA
jgi:hypothetical protein